MSRVVREQSRIIRDDISKKLELGKTHKQIIDELGMDDSTFYRHLKTLRDVETAMWSKIEIDSSRYRALKLLKSFEDTARICENIIKSDRTSNKDRIEACKTKDMANAHILRLVEQGPIFQHLPEVKAYINEIEVNEPVKQLEDKEVEAENEPSGEPSG